MMKAKKENGIDPMSVLIISCIVALLFFVLGASTVTHPNNQETFIQNNNCPVKNISFKYSGIILDQNLVNCIREHNDWRVCLLPYPYPIFNCSNFTKVCYGEYCVEC